MREEPVWCDNAKIVNDAHEFHDNNSQLKNDFHLHKMNDLTDGPIGILNDNQSLMCIECGKYEYKQWTRSLM